MGEIDQRSFEFGRNLKAFRLRRGWTQARLAERIGVTRQTIWSWEQGTFPDYESLVALKETLQFENGSAAELAEFFGETIFAENPLKKSIHFLQNIEAKGFRNIYHNRSDALMAIRPFLERERRSISIVASSLLGVIGAAPESVTAILKSKASELPDFKVLLTDPKCSELREAQEGRSPGKTKEEIAESVKILVDDWHVNTDNVRFYSGAPTIFLLFTSERMLVNPYTYQRQAYETATLEFAPTAGLDCDQHDVFTQYKVSHFLQPWVSDRCSSLSQKRAAAGLKARTQYAGSL